MATYYLIVPAVGVPRVVSRRPYKVAEHEVCYPLDIKRPAGWGEINEASRISVTVPESATMPLVGSKPI